MGEKTGISWCDHTFNPVIGCLKVSDGCTHCYAEAIAKRFGKDVWGSVKTTRRQPMSDNYWKQLPRWNAAAVKAGERRRVFVASMADCFEDHPDWVEPRARLFEAVVTNTGLDFLLLTKRPQNIVSMCPIEWWLAPPANLWVGASIEKQSVVGGRVLDLRTAGAAVRFLSVEPLLEAVDLSDALASGDLHWVIVGGESGQHARPFDPAWATAIRDQCEKYGVAFFFKQNGGTKKIDGVAGGHELEGRVYHEFPKGRV